jgi:hypothetical protein
MTYDNYKMKEYKFYKAYFYVIDKETNVYTRIPTLQQMIDFFDEKYGIQMTHGELNAAKDKALNLTMEKYSDFVKKFAVGRYEYKPKK